MREDLLINIPKQYEDKFCSSGDNGRIWMARVIQFIRNTQDFISSSPYFFPEYTKHTVEHINNVLKISTKLIHSKTMIELGADSIAILIMGIVSHDIGMFVTPDGLSQLLIQETDSDSEELSWRDNWEIYQTQLKHYSSVEIIKYFGDPNDFIINDGLDIMQLPKEISAGKLLPWRKLLCGEFLRKMHPRLAQEIVVNGFPGHERVDLFSNIEIDNEYRKLVGIVARSHGMNIDGLDPALRVFDEEAYEYPCGVPIYYIMAVLRLGDYFDAGEDRAPHSIMSMQRFESEVSYDEFKWNQVVRLGNDWGDKVYERVFIRIELSNIDSRTFLKVEEWLESLQNELDICWRQNALYYKDKFHFSIRRIDSNIFQKTTRKDIESKIVIEKAKLKAAPEILELLIKPLYGGNVTYGVRELLQNAIDACRERKVIERIKGNDNYNGMVLLEVNSECENPYFSIVDNGCGMNKEVILKYFLVAGSSYRNSIKWIEQFETQKINRSGRFGIGVLSSFLVGNRILVETKPVDAQKSFFFEVNNQNYEQINISRDMSINNSFFEENNGGTCIKIEITKEMADKMIKEFDRRERLYIISRPNWFQWYWLSVPMVKYIINGDKWENPFASTRENELYGLEKNGRWFQLKTGEQFDSIWWTPEQTGNIWCNGIYITGDNDFGMNTTYLEYGISDDQNFCLRIPSITVMDSRNSLDLNLSRDKVLSFPENIRQSLYIENCKLALSLLIMRDFSQQNGSINYFPFCLGRREEYMDHLLFSHHGYTLPIQRVVESLEGEMVWLLYRDGSWNYFPSSELSGIISLYYYDLEHQNGPHILKAFHMGEEKGLRLETIQVKKSYMNDFCAANPSRNISGVRSFSNQLEEVAYIVYEDDFYEDGFEEIYDYDSGKFFPYVKMVQYFHNDFIVSARKKNNLENDVLKDLSNFFDVACGYQVIRNEAPVNTTLEKLLDEYLGKEIWIPYNIEQRKKMFPKFFDPQNDIYKYVMMVSKMKGFFDIMMLKDLNNE